MWPGLKVIIIEDDLQSSHDLHIIMDFLGEHSITASSDSWKNIAEEHISDKSEITTILLGQCHGIDRTDMLSSIYEWDLTIPVILIGKQTLPDELDMHLQTMMVGSLSLPLKYHTLVNTLHRAQLYKEHFAQLRHDNQRRDIKIFRSLVGSSEVIKDVRQMMSQVADSEATVLITGESGTGKEVVARNLHKNSKRKDKPFVPINCGAIPPELLESELFGHEKGAFTGAITSRPGRFELAEGGSLFLDEIGDMPPNMQVKLLRILQERCFERVGGTKTILADVRIIAATHKNLEDMIQEGKFRDDLYYRINVFPIEMPALRERSEDIPILLNELIERIEKSNRGSIRFNSPALVCLCEYQWPGNVRELANVVERMAIMHPHGIVGVKDLPKKLSDNMGEISDDEVADMKFPEIIHDEINMKQDERTHLLPVNGIDLKDYLTNLERDLIEQALDDCQGVVARAAERLHIRRTTLVEKMRKYGLQRKQSAHPENPSLDPYE